MVTDQPLPEEQIRLEIGVDWAPKSWTIAGDLKELQGLFDKGVLEPTSEVDRSYREIPSKVVRSYKGTGVKSRLVLKDIAKIKATTGELFASMPTLSSLRTLLALSSARRHEALLRQERHGTLIGDVSRAFIHADMDALIVTRVPKSLHGLRVQYQGEELILLEGMLLIVKKALYGYRKAPRLYQDWFADETKKLRVRRSRIDPSVFWKEKTSILMLVHVDDILMTGQMEEIEKLFADLKATTKLREEGRLERPGDNAQFLGRRLRMTEKGYDYESGTVRTLWAQLGLEKAKQVDSPATKSMTSAWQGAVHWA